MKLDAHNKAATGTRIKTAVASGPSSTGEARSREGCRRDAPTTIASALRQHRVAVVLLVDPQSKIDSLLGGEAQTGSEQVHAGFLLVNVLRDASASAFAEPYGVQSAPDASSSSPGQGQLVQTLPRLR